MHSAALDHERCWFCDFAKRIIQNIVSPADKNSGRRNEANLLRLLVFISQTVVLHAAVAALALSRCCCKQLESSRVVENCKSFPQIYCFLQGERRFCSTDVATPPKKTDCGKQQHNFQREHPPDPVVSLCSCPFYLPFFHLSHPVSPTKPQVKLLL